MQLPEQPARPGQPDPVMDQARLLAAAVDQVLAGHPTSYRDDSPLPAVGTAPPVAQPGQPPMSQWATDVSGVLKAVGVIAVPVGGALWLVGQVDPLTLGIIGGTPIALALAVSRLVGKAKVAIEAAPAPIHQHYHGDVTQDSRSITSTTRGVIANTRNTGSS